MRESFVFHSEYIADLPERYKSVFAIYTINYALSGETPPIEEGTLEYSLWVKIARRVDQESEKYETIKEKRAAAGKKHTGNQYTKETPKEEESPKANPQEEKTGAEEASSEKPKKKNFKKPTVEEIREYCTERKNGVDAQAFYDFYESKGWKVGTAGMKDWRASVRTWEGRRKAEGARQKQTGALWGNESDIPEEIINMI
ncbi:MULTISPECIES: DUF6291 domain-containing protein [unclassified Treponema]|uniref:DUF6291 domain-containing protein n=1 Tax=unclassified Treponema TaxID=2638727 RepID=UPI0020A4D18F|nr:MULTISPECIES: DUF6291 domain-containing protein [unclassified Treponema]UTC65996.1 hypothetical protein E4O06_08160 [Treponema sp. OMZ 789]UTC68726.1 hypothetical protein E4O01_08300 [Treponema sp. OMZ 790]UTC71455.1 hypothetical protein E4O02_08490 [Treponema sp. OMZ 791]